MIVIKGDGTKEEFSEYKIIKTCMRTGVNRNKAEEIARKIKKSTKDETRTDKIYRMILKELDKHSPVSSSMYRLRRSLSEMDSISFEVFFMNILKKFGYKCEWNKIIAGAAVEHQVDVVAVDSEKKIKYMIECKHHENTHRYCGLGDVMETWARLDDINEKNKLFDVAWIVVNTKLSEHAKKYCRYKNMRVTAWNSDEPIETLIKKTNVFPITILNLNNETLQELAMKKIVDTTQIEQNIDWLKIKGYENVIKKYYNFMDILKQE
ncbi:MAG: restriction endonuclease [Candidatus Aenigmarchaeota archaeon]|nr:restriction endonuclease [Candidatus Aenigmarchaeota archaeon]